MYRFVYFICSWKRTFRVRLFCPTYDRLHVLHVSIPHLLWREMLSFLGLVMLAVVLWHLNAILPFVFLSVLVTLRICGEMYVNVAHLLFFFMLVCSAVRFVYILSGVLVFALLQVGKRCAGLCEKLLTILFISFLNLMAGWAFFLYNVCKLPICADRGGWV